MDNNIIVISLGGSLIVPEEIDKSFLEDFKKLIFSQVAKGKKFIIITGGGKICRKYQNVAKEISNLNNEDLDWLGISALKLNAQLLRVILKEYANDKVVNNLNEKLYFEKPIIIGAAYEPGQSTDWDAVLAAQNVKAKTIINLSNTDYVYDSDPKKNINAKKITEIGWQDYRKLIPETWNPGLSSPFDPIASQKAQELGLEVIIMNGKPIDNLANFLNNKNFKGTVIK